MPSTEAVGKKSWMVVYTRSRFEKKIDLTLQQKEIISFCPTITTVRKWADRKKKIEVPLFNSYLFVKADPRQQIIVKETPGVINFIQYNGKPVLIDENEIERIRFIVNSYSDVEAVNISGFKIGDYVSIKDGALVGHDGEIYQISGKSVVMLIKQLNCVLTVKINIEQLAPKPEMVLV